MKYLEAIKKYFGMPYKRTCYTPKDREYYYPMYIDWCGLTRRACIDLEAELGFSIGWWNQGYQVDTLPIILKEEELRTGDIIFYSAKLYDKDAKVHAHQMVHVEVFVGGESGKSSIGARRKGGVVQLFDHFKFESKRFYNTIYHYRSLDTWLDGICRSWCPEHDWIPAKKWTNYYASQHKKKRKEKERAQLNEIDIIDYVQSMDKWQKNWYLNVNYKSKLIISILEKNKGFEELDKTDQWNYKARLALVWNLNELDYARFKMGYHIVNRIPTLYSLTLSKNVLKMWENLKISMKLGYLDTFINLDEIIPEGYILDSIPEVWRFLNCENSGVWDLVSFNYSTPGNISVVDDVLKFKSKIMCLAALEDHELIESDDSEEETGDGEASK